MTRKDWTGDYDYERLIAEENTHYLGIEVTEDLKEGGVHASGCWQHYWQRVADVLHRGPIGWIGDHLRDRFGFTEGPIEILSLGSGSCVHEIALARSLKGYGRVVCTDINKELFLQARDVAATEGLDMEFRKADLNFITIEPGRYRMIFAHAVLHYVINLERLCEEISAGLSPDAILHIVEVVGQNRRLIWDDSEAFANALLRQVPKRITRSIRLAVKPEDAGMEGIRQEKILPELYRLFQPEYELLHGAFMRFICAHPELSRRFDPNDTEARRYLDFLIDCDTAAIRRRVLRPLEVWGVYLPLG